MGLFKLIFYVAIGYIIWRIVISVVRLISAPQPPPRRSDPGPARNPKAPAQKYADIQDAEFEDITPKPPKDPKKPPSAP